MKIYTTGSFKKIANEPELKMEAYRTLHTLNGVAYITVEEHEEILQKVMDFKKALEDAKAAITSVTETTREMGESLKNLGDN